MVGQQVGLFKVERPARPLKGLARTLLLSIVLN